jgi:FdhD protein
MMTASVVRPIRVLRVSPDGSSTRADVAATEEPMEVRVEGEPFAVIMRTPGADRELTAGFLFSERVVGCAADIRSIERDPTRSNVLDVRVEPERARELAARAEGRRRVVMNSACGLCGRVTIESLCVDGGAIEAEWTIAAAAISSMPEGLRRGQAVFAETGGLHGAGIFDRSGTLEILAEDVGRHNAVDKVIGHALATGLHPAVLVLSGRAGYELVQKAIMLGVPIVASVSAPSSLAIELAERFNVALVGFVRGARANVYSHAWRIG